MPPKNAQDKAAEKAKAAKKAKALDDKTFGLKNKSAARWSLPERFSDPRGQRAWAQPLEASSLTPLRCQARARRCRSL